MEHLQASPREMLSVSDSVQLGHAEETDVASQSMLPQPSEEHAQHWPGQFDAVSIQSLPPELLREVFSSYITLSYRPFRLAHVCRLWRQVAFASPELWVSLWVPYVPPSLGHRQADYVDVWRQWLSRCSGGWPLHLDFHVNRGGVFQPEPCLSPYLVDVLRPHSAIITSLDLILDITFASSDILAMPSGSFPSLRSLCIWFSSAETFPDESLVPRGGPSLTFTDAPGLRSLELSSLLKLWPNPQKFLQLNWTLLTLLDIRWMSDDDDATVHLLLKCTNLERLEVFIDPAWPYDYPMNERIKRVTFPHLRDIYLQVDSELYGTDEPFFECFRCPNLRKLKVEYVFPRCDCGLLLNRGFQRLSLGSLTELELEGACGDSGQLLRALRYAPALQTLHLVNSFVFTPVFYERLAELPITPVPRLRSLQVSPRGEEDFDRLENGIIAMLLSRWKAHGEGSDRLRNVCILSAHDEFRDHTPLLEDLRRIGMSVRLAPVHQPATTSESDSDDSDMDFDESD
ncbi:hypothetical protein EV714DRAFT_205316 [Schizophyllum commune]